MDISSIDHFSIDKKGFLVNDYLDGFPFVVVQLGSQLFKLKLIKDKINVYNIPEITKKYDVRFLSERIDLEV